MRTIYFIKFISLFLSNVHAYNIGIVNFYKPFLNSRTNMRMIVPDYDPSKIINSLAKSADVLDKYNFNDFIQEANKHNLESVSLIKNMGTDTINALVAIDKNYNGDLPDLDNLHYLETGLTEVNKMVIDTILKNDIFYKIVQLPNSNNQMMQGFDGIGFIINIVVFYFIINFIFTLLQQFRGGGGGMGGMMNPMNTGRLQSKGVIDSSEIDTKFSDVAGCDEAKYELEEVVEFLKSPDKFNQAGAKIPKGVLLDGPPGTGKTLLARAVAGEAGVSFIQVSASEFIQMFVGVGASRVRDLFKIAKENSPCVVFIDEIDAVGRKRGEQFGGGGNEEREQTLNQILTNMDGFEKSDSIVVLAATNRADILDSALTRSGRFDRKVSVTLPDVRGRRQIFDIHLRDKFVEDSTDLDEVAVLTSGFSGADIENMANEAVILALRQNTSVINSTHLMDAYEKITIGLPKKEAVIDKKQERLVAYHEAGHTITALLFREFFDVRKVTINQNSNGAGGYTLFTPKEEFMSYPTKKYLLANLIITMGGRAAEMILYKKLVKDVNSTDVYDSNKLFDSIKNLDITTGASQDLKQADNLARQYIQLFGIENTKGITRTIQNPDSPYLTLSEDTKSEIDTYVDKLISYALRKALEILDYNIHEFRDLGEDLIKYKTVGLKYLDNIPVIYY